MLLLLACATPEPAVVPTDSEDPAAIVDPDAPLTPPEYGVQMTIGPVTLEAHQEIYWCKTQRLPNSAALDIVGLAHRVTTGAHHYNVWGLVVGPEEEEGPCDEIWAKANMSVGAPLYASQDPTFSGEFPPGVGAQLLPNLLVLQELHFINTRDVPVEVSGEINIVAAAPGTELIYANGLFGSIDDIALEPKTEVVLRQKCTVPVDMDVFVLGSHFHSRGTRFEINLLDEAGEPGELVYESTDWQSPPLNIMANDPIHIPAGGGFSYACTFKNDTDDWIYAGESSTEEMCMMVGIYYPDAGFLRCTQ
ncbi:MAG TPA: hypothetical protein PLA94_19305 [Myxococcota bacterium]|nr:hypothetical protein [Myxococcota bacterium]HND32164.1 hypothetical protein [Myxococcota bacterium]